MIGDAFALLSATCFSIANVTIVRGTTPGDDDNGAFVSLLLTTAIAGAGWIAWGLAHGFVPVTPRAIAWFAIRNASWARGCVATISIPRAIRSHASRALCISSARVRFRSTSPRSRPSCVVIHVVYASTSGRSAARIASPSASAPSASIDVSTPGAA